jgi:predicted TIM-barrel fold metal-dependent hydrolase
MGAAANIDANRSIAAQPRVADRVVDADVHVTPPPTFWAEYLSPGFRDRAPIIESDGDCDWIVFEGTRKRWNLMQSQAGRTFEQYKNDGKVSDMRVGGYVLVKRLEDMDHDGIDQGVVFGGGPLQTGSMDLYLDSFEAYNRWQSDFCAASKKRLFGAAFLPTMSVETAVAMMKAARARGDVAVNMPAFPQSAEHFNKSSSLMQALMGDPHGRRQYRDAEFEPIWQTAIDLNMAITFHLGARVVRYTDKALFLPDLAVSKTPMLEIIAPMIFNGLFDRFPELRVGLIESGAGWMPWAAEYMDRIWFMQRHWTGCAIKHEPSYYFDRNIYCSFISDKVGVALRHFPGGKNIMWSSDYPHSETTFPHSHEVIADHFKGVSGEDRDWILSGCAEKFYGLR